MTDDVKTTFDLTQLVHGVGNNIEKDLIGQIVNATNFNEKMEKASDLTIGKLISWMLLEGVPMANMEITKKCIRITDKIDAAVANGGQWEVTESDISQLEEMINKVENPQMNIGKFKIPLAKLFTTGKKDIDRKRDEAPIVK